MNKASAALSGTILAMFLAGCSNSDSASPNPGEPDGQPQATGGEPVELTIYSAGGTNNDEFEKNYAEFIRQKFPHIAIKYINPREGEGSKLENLILAGVNIDLYYESIGTFFSTLPRNQAQYDLTELIKQHGVDLNRFEPTLIDALRQNGNGEIWGLPVTTNGMSLYYNKELFDKFGVPYLKDGMTWEEVYAVAAKLNRSDGGQKIVGLAVSPSHSMRMNAYSLPFVDPATLKSTYSDERWRRILEPILKPAEDSLYRSKMDDLGGKLPYSAEWLKTQELAILGVFSDWQVVSPNPVPFDWDMAAYPTMEDQPGVGSQQYPVYWAIPSFAQHKEQAFEVLKYLVSDEYQLEVSKRGGLTVLNNPEIRKAFGQNSIHKDKNLAAAYYNKFAPISPKTAFEKTAETALTSKLPDLAAGRIDLNTALRQAEEEANKAIEAASP
ncbi:ABC transporter substrate-binding protein [Paenibacillus ginsengihumi]|uniref:ABC transporter substrate-binding protein n=1 Tax=Paenibacillus ginsengihumi TaxID=431596 RepID=UPI00035DE0D5|nr:ABC transporter substrate-binding protein [Paenibacillus ginsengihumi]